jgi:hypothetical protein
MFGSMGKFAASGASKTGLRGKESEEWPDGRPRRESVGDHAEETVDAVSVRARFGVCTIVRATLSRAMVTRSSSTLPGRAGRGGGEPLGLAQGRLYIELESGRSCSCTDGIGREMDVTRALLD